MKLTSPDFKNKDKILVRFTGDGEDVNPELIIENVPENAKSLVLIVDDPDAVGGWDHWIVWNIPATGKILKINENSIPGVQGKTSWGGNEYRGPKPPSGTHRYFFRIFALDTVLNLKEGSHRRELEEAMKSHVLEKAELIGLYR